MGLFGSDDEEKKEESGGGSDGDEKEGAPLFLMLLWLVSACVLFCCSVNIASKINSQRVRLQVQVLPVVAPAGPLIATFVGKEAGQSNKITNLTYVVHSI